MHAAVVCMYPECTYAVSAAPWNFKAFQYISGNDEPLGLLVQLLRMPSQFTS